MNRVLFTRERPDSRLGLRVGTSAPYAASTDRLALGRMHELEARHQELDARLRELGRHAYLTPSEQRESTELKKLKLQAKDELATLRRTL